MLSSKEGTKATWCETIWPQSVHIRGLDKYDPPWIWRNMPDCWNKWIWHKRILIDWQNVAPKSGSCKKKLNWFWNAFFLNQWIKQQRNPARTTCHFQRPAPLTVPPRTRKTRPTLPQTLKFPSKCFQRPHTQSCATCAISFQWMQTAIKLHGSTHWTWK